MNRTQRKATRIENRNETNPPESIERPRKEYQPLAVVRLVDKKWFFEQKDAKHLTLEKIGAAMGLDRSAVSNMLAGKRRMQTDEAATLASLLGQPIEEVARRAGIDVRSAGPTDVAVEHHAGPDGHLEQGPEAFRGSQDWGIATPFGSWAGKWTAGSYMLAGQKACPSMPSGACVS